MSSATSHPSSPSYLDKELSPLNYPGSAASNSGRSAANMTVTLGDSHLQKQNFVASGYRALSWIFGFREKWTLVWALTFGGALLGFCLARAMTMNPRIAKKEAAAGEFFWFDKPFFKINYFIHTYFTLIGGAMVGIQFFPTIRRRFIILHRLNGYFCLFCLVPGNISGSLIAAKSYGGEINVQASYYLLGIMITFSGILGWWNVKRDTRGHRKWMLRMVTYFCAVITARIIAAIGKEIITAMGSWYSVWRCDQILYVLKSDETFRAQFPQCLTGNDLSKNFAVVLASMKGGKLMKASATRVMAGMAVWLATVIHGLGIEIYIQATESANHSRYGYALEPVDYKTDEEPWQYKK